MNTKLWIYDTTLRDGSQAEGISLSSNDKLKIARQLDAMGVPFIEGGWPGANPKDVEFFTKLQEEPLTQAEVVAFCATRRPNQLAASDPMLQGILAANTKWITIFGKSWDLHVTSSLKTSLEENLAMILDSITFLCSQGRKIIYDAEHWFDGYKHNPEYAIETLRTAISAGASWLVLCDTNGGTLPHEVTAIVEAIYQAIPELHHPDYPKIGIHTHNDGGTAVANAIAAVRAGATMVQGTINGYGERCGNSDLCSFEIVNFAPDARAPFVGRSAFTHKAGIHVSAVQKNPITYEHIEPTLVGNQRQIIISEQSGMSNLLYYAQKFGLNLEKTDPRCRAILRNLKELENHGYQFEAAEASFELMMRSVIEQREPLFELRGCQVHCDIKPQSDPFMSNAFATIKLTVNNQDLLEVAEGIGPVAALDRALRQALTKFYPTIATFTLTDYKVRILDGTMGTAARIRVLVESSNGSDRWTTIGVSTNILDASYQAVVEGIEYGLLLKSFAERPDLHYLK